MKRIAIADVVAAYVGCTPADVYVDRLWRVPAVGTPKGTKVWGTDIILYRGTRRETRFSCVVPIHPDRTAAELADDLQDGG